MLRLRQAHMDAFEVHVVNMFLVRVLTHLKALWSAECDELGDAALEEWVRGAIRRGASYGLSTEYDIVRFVDLTFILAPDFDTNRLVGWARPILADRVTAPSLKVDRLYKRMEDEFALIEKRKGRQI